MLNYFNTVCKNLNLGEILSVEQVNGGKTNKVFKVTTSEGAYAIKIISHSNIVKDRKILINIEISEYISNSAKDNGVSAIAAKKYNGSYIQKINEQYILVYDWYYGTMPYNQEIKQQDVKKLAHELALLHKVEPFKNVKARTNTEINFDKYITLLLNKDEEWASYILERFDDLKECYKISWESYEKLSGQYSFVHGDLNSKNILINDNNVWLLDWETAKIGNPSLDFFYTSWFGIGNYDDEKYYTFVKEYLSTNDLVDDINVSSYATLTEEFAWLELCIKRGLELQSQDKDEINIGKDSAVRSLDRILDCYKRIPEMLKIVRKAKDEIKNEKDIDER